MRRHKPHSISFITWHEKQLFTSFAWLVSCLLCGFLFVSIIEVVGLNVSGIGLIAMLLVLYLVGLAIIELFRRFWLGFSYAQHCANLATCQNCNSYGLFKVIIDTQPIYARCKKCDYRWVIK